MTPDPARTQKRVYTQRLEVERLRRAAFERDPPAISADLLDAETRLVEMERDSAEAERASGALGGVRLGPETTGLDASATLGMAQVPTSIVHLLQRHESPLVRWHVRNVSRKRRRLRLTSSVAGYSARAVDSVELARDEELSLDQLPTFFPAKLRQVSEVTRASVEVALEDLDGKIELHRTEPVWLLARTTVPLAVQDPSTAALRDMTPYLGAFVTPNAPAIMTFLREVARRHPDGRLIGYQIGEVHVEPQVRAVFEALKEQGITYVNSVLAMTPEQGLRGQRVRLPRESLEDKQANCIDGTVLFASLLEAMSLEAAIVIVPGHAFVGWRTWREEPSAWRFLETTMIGSRSFEEACASGQDTATRYQKRAAASGEALSFRQWVLQDLRVGKGIFPME
jgi:hypothetical protein